MSGVSYCPCCGTKNQSMLTQCATCRTELTPPARKNPVYSKVLSNTKLAIFDIDKTILNTTERFRSAERAGLVDRSGKAVKGRSKERDAFLYRPDMLSKDTVLPGVKEIIKHLMDLQYTIAYCTARNERHRQATRIQLEDRGFPMFTSPSNENLLFMRPSSRTWSESVNAKYKRDVFQRLKGQYDVRFVFDDRIEILNEAAALDIPGTYSSVAEYWGKITRTNPEPIDNKMIGWNKERREAHKKKQEEIRRKKEAEKSPQATLGDFGNPVRLKEEEVEEHRSLSIGDPRYMLTPRPEKIGPGTVSETALKPNDDDDDDDDDDKKVKKRKKRIDPFEDPFRIFGNPPPKPPRKKKGRREPSKVYFRRLMTELNEEFPQLNQRVAVALNYVEKHYGKKARDTITEKWAKNNPLGTPHLEPPEQPMMVTEEQIKQYRYRCENGHGPFKQHELLPQVEGVTIRTDWSNAYRCPICRTSDLDITVVRKLGNPKGRFLDGEAATMVFIKPRGLDAWLDIKRMLPGPIMKKRWVKVDKKLISAHYAEHEHKPHFSKLVDYYNGRWVLALVVGARYDAVRAVIGSSKPDQLKEGDIRKTILDKYGDSSYGLLEDWTSGVDNGIHASDSVEAADRELELWFGRKPPKQPKFLNMSSHPVEKKNDGGFHPLVGVTIPVDDWNKSVELVVDFYEAMPWLSGWVKGKEPPIIIVGGVSIIVLLAPYVFKAIVGKEPAVQGGNPFSEDDPLPKAQRLYLNKLVEDLRRRRPSLMNPRTNPANPGKVNKGKKLYKHMNKKEPDNVTKEMIDIGDVWYQVGEGGCWQIGYMSGKETGKTEQKYTHIFNEETKNGNYPKLYATIPDNGKPLLIIKGGTWKIKTDDTGVAWIYD